MKNKTVVLSLLWFVGSAFGQVFNIKDSHGVTLARISDVKLFDASNYFFKDGTPWLHGTVESFVKKSVPVIATIHRKDGSTFVHSFIVRDDHRLFINWEGFCIHPYCTPDNYSVSFSLDTKEWLELERRAEQQRIAQQERKKRAEQERQRAADEKAAKEAKDAAEKAKLRAACSIIFKRTSEKKVSDLTVTEDQQVKACQKLGMYSR